MLEYIFKIRIPGWLERILIPPILLYRRLRFGCPFRKIPLTRGKFAIVDPLDYPELAKFKWRICKNKSKHTCYAERSIRKSNGKFSRILMHRQILEPQLQSAYLPRQPLPDLSHCKAEGRSNFNCRVTSDERRATNFVIDHVNRIGLDNRRANLRLATPAQNAANSRKRANQTGYKGVCLDKQKKRYRASITANRKKYHLGYFNSPIDAAIAYDVAAKKLHKQFASPNFPPPRYPHI